MKRGKNSQQHSKKDFIFLTVFLIAVLAFTFLIYISITARIVEEIQPNATIGKDAFIQEDKPNENKGIYKKIKVDSETTKQINGLIQFDLSSIPSNITINSATLGLYLEKGAAQTYNIEIHKITKSWTETGVTWNSRDGTNNWTTAGGDYDPIIFASLSVNKTKGWRLWNITELVRGWKNGTWPNYGMILVSATSITGNNVKEFISSDNSGKKSDKWPKLIIDYTIITNDTIAPNSTLTNPANDANLTSQTVIFNCSATDNVQLSNITLYGNWSGGWHANETKSVSGTSNSTSFTKTITDGNYRWNCYVCDNSSNCNFALADRTFTIDTTPPGTVTGLSETATSQTWIYWTWTNPSDADFSHVEIWLNGTFKINTAGTSYNATSLSPNTWYEIQTRTVDDFGNINTNWVNDTAKTLAPIDNPPTTNLIAPSDSSTDNDGSISFICNATDDNQLNSMTFYWNYSGTWQTNGTQAINGISNQTTFTRTNLSNGAILWNCYSCDNSSQCDFADANWTVTVNYSAPCVEDWIVQYGSCLTNDSKLKYYIDGNTCGTYDDLPVDNGTYVSCNYCSENITGPFNTSCNISDQLTQYWIDNNYATCCAVTGLTSDCNINNGSYDNQTFACNYCSEDIQGPFNTSCNASSLLTQYYVDNNYATCCAVTGLAFDCHINNGSYNNQTFACEYEEPSGGGGGGRGRGVAPAAPAPKPKAEICDLTIPLEENMIGTCILSEGESIYFKLDGVTHSIIVNKINNNVEIAIYYSLPYKSTLAIGQSEEVDLDGDDVADIAIKLDKIKDDKATITVTAITKFKPMALGVCKCPECTEWSKCEDGRQTRTCYDCGTETNFTCVSYDEEQDCVIKVKPREFSWLWALFVLLWVSLGVLIYLAYMHKKKRKKAKKGKKKK